ncbi:MAG TPA: GNAT family N-acetyltransferase [Steroidobacteraceae bacterium]|nr:GNAT family N-acetyltransferase [Steroidobacteraceae bacterium]
MSRRHARTIASLAVPVAQPVQRLAGTLIATGAPVTIAYAGDPAAAEFIAGALCKVERREPVGRLGSPLELRSEAFVALAAAADLVAMEVPWAWQRCLPDDTQWRMPAWVSQEILATDLGHIVLPVPLRKEVRRHERRQGYEMRFSTDDADVRRFHAMLYRPYVEARHGSGAVIVDERQFFAVSRGMTLATLTSAGEWVAGLLLQRRATTLHFGWFGSASVPPPPGASEVLDARVLEWAAQNGIRRVVMGHSRPSLADGVVRYKRRFGAVVRPTRFPQRILGLRIQRSSPALVAAIEAARFIGFRDGQIEIYRPESESQARRTGR